MKKALVIGISGQDGSYLAELLLSKGYEVHGVVRRSSSINTARIDHIFDSLRLHYGDLADGSGLAKLLAKVQPDEVYNLGAQSHVKVSFDVPEYTADVTGTGTIRLLEAIRSVNQNIRFYQASSSEMFGLVQETPQRETTPFYPRSPYGCAKVFSYWATVNYRESYGMHCSNGILFNHETVTACSPMICKDSSGIVHIKSIAEIVKECGVVINEKDFRYQCGLPTRALWVWDASGWTKIKAASAYPHQPENDDKRPKIINARNACYQGTSSHVAIMEAGEKEFGELRIGDKIKNIKHPTGAEVDFGITEDKAMLLGMLAADGYCPSDKKFYRLTKNVKGFLDAAEKACVACGGTVRYGKSSSGFGPGKVDYILLRDSSWLDEFELYSGYEVSVFGKRCKQVPFQVLNAPVRIQMAYLRGYNLGDGLKAGPSICEFKNFKTNSQALAAGLIFLISQTTKQEINLTVEESNQWKIPSVYYSINLLSDTAFGDRGRTAKLNRVKEMLGQGLGQREIFRATGISRCYIRSISREAGKKPHHLKKPGNEVKKVLDLKSYKGWFYDIETESGTFHCGVGYGLVHNSPRRGETFVTRKITRALARIKYGLQDKLVLGNLDAKRDWGFAKDYVEAMWLMLQQPTSDDYVVATGETHTVSEFLDIAIERAKIPGGRDFVVSDPKYFRPAEVDILLGDATKAFHKLNWKPKTSFRELVHLMMDADLAEVVC